MKRLLGLLAILFCASLAAADELPPAIEDNSFLLEEAYNQDAGVVQHIATFQHFRTPSVQSDFSFAQEWPLGPQKHQVSFSVPYSRVEGEGDFGDIFLNYRHQLAGLEGGLAIAPRLSLFFSPGGDHGGGVQVALPLSRRMSTHLALHANVGATFVRDAKGPAEVRHGLSAFHAGASAVGIVTPTLNLMVEALVTSEEEIDGIGTARHTSAVIAPGLRTAINRGELQIVPGAGVPITFDGDRTDAGFYLYLSVEHPFKR